MNRFQIGLMMIILTAPTNLFIFGLGVCLTVPGCPLKEPVDVSPFIWLPFAAALIISVILLAYPINTNEPKETKK